MAYRDDKTKKEALAAFNVCSELIVFDTETTGFSAKKHHIIQISGKKYKIIHEDIFKLEEIDTIDLFINPGYSIPAEITAINHISDETLADKPTESECFDEIYKFFENAQIVAGHNVPFDIKMIKAMYERQGKTFEFDFKLDTKDMAKDIVSKEDVPNFKLGTLVEHFGLDTGILFHNSLDDVIATARLLMLILKEYQKEQEVVVNKKVAKVFSVNFWEGYQKGNHRIYANTNIGSFYYEFHSRMWYARPDNPNKTTDVDMERFQNDVYKLIGVSDEAGLRKYRKKA